MSRSIEDRRGVVSPWKWATALAVFATAVIAYLAATPTVRLEPLAESDATVAARGFVDQNDAQCIECHSKQLIAPQNLLAHSTSFHQKAAVGCTECHLQPHRDDAEDNRPTVVSACIRCHAKQATMAAGDPHSMAAANMIAAKEYRDDSSVESGATCWACHVGKGAEVRHETKTPAASCLMCHRGHQDDKVAVRANAACAACHQGEGIGQHEAFVSSPHGRLKADGHATANCVDCHDPHNAAHGIAFGASGSGRLPFGTYLPLDVPTMTTAEFQKRRSEMLDRCDECHTRQTAGRYLSEADAVKREVDLELSKVLKSLTKLAAVKPDAVRNLQNENGYFKDRRFVGMGSSQLEQLYFELIREAYPGIWKAAYHFSPAKVSEAQKRFDRLVLRINEEVERLSTQSKSPTKR